ncbi:hypothetical protein MRB53_017468 [Persea americana]|uniref:Uncharacterized protein n=1 Tax=Persea americana TaxID=3435 RepID=A0ACC2M584_PERAE|nr:hypothetical protein MRB53_017468 [Persea americana]
MDFGGSNALTGSSSDSLPMAPDSGTMERGRLGPLSSSLSCKPDQEEPGRSSPFKKACGTWSIWLHSATTRTTPLSTTPVSGDSASNSVAEAQELTESMENAIDSSAMHISSISFLTTSPGLLIANGVPMVTEEDSFKGSSQSESELISWGTALNPQPRNGLECGNIHSSLDFNDKDSEDPESLLLHQLIEEWNEDKYDRLDIIWPEACPGSHFKNL